MGDAVVGGPPDDLELGDWALSSRTSKRNFLTCSKSFGRPFRFDPETRGAEVGSVDLEFDELGPGDATQIDYAELSAVR